MPKPIRSDLRLHGRALRQGWNIPAAKRTEIVDMLIGIVNDQSATPRERTSAARALLQATRVELDAIRVAQAAQYEDLIRRMADLEGESDAGLATAAGGH